MPFENYIGRIEVRKINEGQTEIAWGGTFDMTTGHEDGESQTVEKVECMLSGVVDGLEKLHGSCQPCC